MKKILNFLLLLLMTVVAQQALAYDVVLMTDGTTQCKDGIAWIGGSSHTISTGLNEFSASNKNLMVRGNSNNSTFNAVIHNGGNVSKSGSGNGFSPNSYNATLTDGFNLIEVYSSRSVSNPYTYPLNFSFMGDKSSIVSIRTSKGNTYTGNETSVNFVYNEKFTVTVDHRCQNASLSKGSTVTETQSGTNWVYEFTPFPAKTTPTFSLTIPDVNVEYNLTVNNGAGQILAWQLGSETPVASLSKFRADQTVTVYTLSEPWSVSGATLSAFSQATYNGTPCYKATFTTPPSNVTLNFEFTTTFTTNVGTDAYRVLSYSVTNRQGQVTTLSFNDSGVNTVSVSKSDRFTIYTKYVPTQCEPTLGFAAATLEGQSCYKAEFNATYEGTLSMSFSGGTFYMQVQDDDLTTVMPYIAGYQVIHDNNKVADLHHIYNSDPGQQFSEWGSCTTNFSVGDTYVLYLTVVPESVVLDGNELEYESVEIDEQLYCKYSFTPTDDGHLNITFGNTGTVAPPVEETFSITVNVDHSNIVTATCIDQNNNVLAVHDLVQGDNSGIETPVSGKIVITVADGFMFTKCNVDAVVKSTTNALYNKTQTVDMLVYDPPTKYPVTISNQMTVDYEDNTYMESSGYGTFYIETMDVSTLNWYSIKVDIDDPENAVIEVGKDQGVNSAENRVITGLDDGVNTIAYNELETYMVISPAGLNQIYSVTATGATVDDKDAALSIYRVGLSAETNNATVNIQVNRPIEPGVNTFTFNIDHVEYMDVLKRFIDGYGYPVTDLVNGPNTLTFNDGEFFRLFTDADYTPTVKLNNVNVDPYFGMYDITPSANCVVDVVYGDVVLPTYTVVTDMPQFVTKIVREERNKTDMISEQFTTLSYVAGDVCKVYVSREPKRAEWVSESGSTTTLEYKLSTYYEFTPTDKGQLKLIFNVEPQYVPKFVFNVDDKTKINKIYDTDTDDDYTAELVNGRNLIPVGEGALRVRVAEVATSFKVDGVDVASKYNASNGTYYNIDVEDGTVVDVIFAKDPKFTLIIDQPSRLSGLTDAATNASLLADVVAGSTVLDFERGHSYVFTPSAGAPLSFTVNGIDVAANGNGTYTYTPAAGDVVKVFFNYVPSGNDLYLVKVNLVNEGSAGVISHGWVGDSPLLDAPALIGGVLVDANDEYGISLNSQNSLYILNSFVKNGTALDLSTFNGVHKFNVGEDTQITIDARRPIVINYTITVNNKDAVELYYGNLKTAESTVTLTYALDANDQPIISNIFHVVTDEFNQQLTIAPVGENLINSVADSNDVEYTADVDNRYTINLTDGLNINIVTEAVSYDETMYVSIYGDMGDSEYRWDNGCASLTSPYSGRTISLNPGVNRVKFNSRYDREFRYSISPKPKYVHTFYEDDEISGVLELLDAYVVIPNNGSLLRTFFEYRTALNEKTGDYDEVDSYPTPCEVTFNIESSVAGDVLVLREDFETVDPNNNNSEIKGTRYFVYVKSDKNVALLVKPTSGKGASAPERRNAKAKVSSIAHETPLGYKYVDDFVITKPVNISLSYSDFTVGIEDVEAAETVATNSIYNLQGILVKADATAADLRELPAGVYIFNGKKVLVK